MTVNECDRLSLIDYRSAIAESGKTATLAVLIPAWFQPRVSGGRRSRCCRLISCFQGGGIRYQTFDTMSGYGYTCTSRDPRCNYAEGTRNMFTNQMEYGNPGYVPTLWVGILFFTVFGLSTIAHVAQGIYKRTWWCLWTFVFCGIGELCGWGGRIWMEQSMRWRPEQGGFYSFNRNVRLSGAEPTDDRLS